MADDVLTLNDLHDWNRPGTGLAVLGHPIRHSVSPPMHNEALREMRRRDPRFADWQYHRFEVAPDDLPLALQLLHRHRFRGINLTVPHKILAFDLIGKIDEDARPIGAVNTLLWQKEGYAGFNTDGFGLAEGLRHDLKLKLAEHPVILLGAGGAARGAAIECLQAGCPRLAIGNRTESRARDLAGLLQGLRPDFDVSVFDPARPPRDLPAEALVINATSAGLKATDPMPIVLDHLPGRSAVFDMIYNPSETPLLKTARTRGLAATNGFSMLIYQGVRSLEIWSGASVPVEAMFRGARQGMAGL